MSFVLDIIIVLIILFFAFTSAKKGFVRTLIEVVGFILAISIALSISTPVASKIYDGAVQPIIAKSVESAVNESAEGANAAVDAVWNKLPSFIAESSFLGLSKDGLSASLSDNAATTAEQITTTISDSFIKPAVTRLLSVLISVILVIVLLFVVKIIAKFINKLFSFSVIGKLNRTLGGLLGVLKGIAVSIVFCMIISLILSFTKNGFLIFTYESINASYLFKLLLSFSPFI